MDVERIGRYEVLQVLGRGAMGVVYLVRDPIIDRRLAVKTLRVDLDDEHADEFRERFTREARAAGRLTHNGIVTIHDVGEDPETGLVFIAMEYIKGHDLKQILASGHRFRPSEAARIAADVAQALDYAHSMGVIHRDIKPANVILTADGTAKIMDFGVARLESSNLTVEGQFIGTPNFMSPEQITGKAVDGRSDIFSLGVLLYNLLTGLRPFGGDTMHEVTMKIVQEPCSIPSTVSPGLPAAFNPIVLKCMEKDPEKRFQTGGEVARVLSALARSAVQREPGGPERAAVVSPDLETRVVHPAADEAVARTRTISPSTAAIKLPKIKQRKPLIRPLLDRLPLPPLLLKEVRPKWLWPIIASWVLLWTVIITTLVFTRDPGPFPAPSDGAVRNLHVVASELRRAGRLLEQDRLGEAEQVGMSALAQVPSSPGGRRLMGEIRRRLDVERNSEANIKRVDDLVSEGRRRYRSGDYGAAAESFEGALEINPESEMASSFLELTVERRQQEQAPQVQRLDRRRPTPVPQRRRSAPAAGHKAQPTPGTARITVYFNSPISEGSVVVRRNDETIADLPFNFTKRVLGIKRKGTGQVKKVLIIPSGSHTLSVELNEEEEGSMGAQSFTETFSNGSDWSLRIDLPKKATEARFFLVKTGR